MDNQEKETHPLFETTNFYQGGDERGDELDVLARPESDCGWCGICICRRPASRTNSENLSRNPVPSRG